MTQKAEPLEDRTTVHFKAGGKVVEMPFEKFKESVEKITGAQHAAAPRGDATSEEYRAAPKGDEAYGIIDKLVAEVDSFAPIAETETQIGVYYKEFAWESGGRETWGKCVKQSDLNIAFHGFHYLILLAESVWKTLTEKQREALVYHELRHIEIKVNDKTGDVSHGIVKHDVEMFTDELTRYGAWTRGIDGMVRVARQAELFDHGND